jgi:hypothetical protein
MKIDHVSVKMMEIDQAVFTVRGVPSWARPIMDFFVDGQVPADENEAPGLQGDPKDIPS